MSPILNMLYNSYSSKIPFLGRVLQKSCIPILFHSVDKYFIQILYTHSNKTRYRNFCTVIQTAVYRSRMVLWDLADVESDLFLTNFICGSVAVMHFKEIFFNRMSGITQVWSIQPPDTSTSPVSCNSITFCFLLFFDCFFLPYPSLPSALWEIFSALPVALYPGCMGVRDWWLLVCQCTGAN